MLKNLLSSRRFRQGSLATAITAAVLLLLVLVNMVAAQLGQRYSWNIDLTADGLFTVSEDTIAYLETLDKDVDIYILNTETNFTADDVYAKQALEVIKKYQQHSSRINVTFVDLIRNPGFATRYNAYQPTLNCILVESGDEVRLLTPDELFNWQVDEYGYYVTSSKAEQVMTGTIVSVTTNEIITTGVVSGHGESQAGGITNLLLLNNYNVLTVNTLSQDIPDNVTLLVISAPLADYTDEEIEKLDAFLYNNGAYGKTVFYLASIDQPELPNLEAFLQRWGIQLGEGVVFETNYSLLSANSLFFTSALYAEESYSRVVMRSGVPVSLPNSRPMELLEAPGVSTTVLLQFSGEAGIRSPESLGNDNWRPSNEEICGPIPALVLSQRSQGGVSSHVLVAPSSLTLDESILATPTMANSRYFLSLLGELTFREDNVVIENKTLGAPMLNISYGQAMVWGFVFAVLLPVAVLVTGAVAFLRRRHL